jgi:hypothetical protein
MSCNATAKAASYRKDPTPLEIVLKNLPKLDPADRLVVAQRLSELCQGKDSTIPSPLDESQPSLVDDEVGDQRLLAGPRPAT